MKEREESGVELRVVKNKTFFYSLFTTINLNKPVLSGVPELGIGAQS